jgi:hypothetical protein
MLRLPANCSKALHSGESSATSRVQHSLPLFRAQPDADNTRSYHCYSRRKQLCPPQGEADQILSKGLTLWLDTHCKVGLVGDGGGCAGVGRDTNVLKDEGPVQEDGVGAVGGEGRGQAGAVEGGGQSQVGGGSEGGTDVDEGAGNGGGAGSGQGGSQEAYVVDFIIGDLSGIGLDGGGEESLLATNLQKGEEDESVRKVTRLSHIGGVARDTLFR